LARGVEDPRFRYIVTKPERRIYPEELDCLKSYLSLVVEGLDLNEGGRRDGKAEATPAGNRSAQTPRADDQTAGADASGSKTPPPADVPDLVTLNQAASMAHKSKRTLERYKTKGNLPDPAVEGGGGRAALYDWKVIRPWLESEFGIKKLPEEFPANRRHA
jgi:hypothetical protein